MAMRTWLAFVLASSHIYLHVPSTPPLLLAPIRNYRISSPMPSIGLNCTLRLHSRPSSSSNSSRPDFLLLVAPQAIVSSSLTQDKNTFVARTNSEFASRLVPHKSTNTIWSTGWLANSGFVLVANLLLSHVSDLYHYFTRPGIWLGMSGPSTETDHKR